MKIINLAILMIIAIIMGCGKDEYYNTTLPEKIIEVEKPFEVPMEVRQDFEGYYACENNSYLELYVDASDRVTFETLGQSLVSINPKNGSLATHPLIGDRDLMPLDEKTLYLAPRNYNYSSSVHDIEEDVSGSNITGNRRTDIQAKLTESKLGLTVTIFIYQGAVNSNINKVIAKRTFNCEKY